MNASVESERKRRPRTVWTLDELNAVLAEAGRIMLNRPFLREVEVLRLAQKVLPVERWRDITTASGDSFAWFRNGLKAAVQSAHLLNVAPPDDAPPAPIVVDKGELAGASDENVLGILRSLIEGLKEEREESRRQIAALAEAQDVMKAQLFEVIDYFRRLTTEGLSLRAFAPPIPVAPAPVVPTAPITTVAARPIVNGPPVPRPLRVLLLDAPKDVRENVKKYAGSGIVLEFGVSKIGEYPAHLTYDCVAVTKHTDTAWVKEAKQQIGPRVHDFPGNVMDIVTRLKKLPELLAQRPKK